MEICLSSGSSCFPIFIENAVHSYSLERRWNWHGRDFPAFLDAGSREIYLECLIVVIKISIFGAWYRFSYRMEKDNDISPYRFIVPPLLDTFKDISHRRYLWLSSIHDNIVYRHSPSRHFKCERSFLPNFLKMLK